MPILTQNETVYIQSDAGTGDGLQVGRGAFLFDTSNLPNALTIDSAECNVWVYAVADTFSAISPTVNIFSVAPASDTAESPMGEIGNDTDIAGTEQFAPSRIEPHWEPRSKPSAPGSWKRPVEVMKDWLAPPVASLVSWSYPEKAPNDGISASRASTIKTFCPLLH